MSQPHFSSPIFESMAGSLLPANNRILRGKLSLVHAIAALVLCVMLTSQVSAQDTDADGILNVDEATYGTSPTNPDTDGDGAGDWYEVFASFTSPTNLGDKPNVPYSLPKPDNSTGATNKPVKVFILAGQSNMVGMGDMNPITANGTLSKIVKTEKKFPNLLDNSGNWSVRKDVQYRGVISAIAKGNLTVGQGSSTSTIGPELGMGHVMGYHLDEPVLILKAAQGNRSLLWDFLPPGSPRSTAGSTTYAGYGDSAPSWTGAPPGPPTTGNSYAGWQYDQSFLAFGDWYGPGSTADVENVADVLDNWSTEYPQWAAQGFEIAGFAWFQGWNDGLSYTTQAADRYEANLVQLIKQLRAYYEGRYPTKIQPKAPFVVATCGFNGFAATGNRLKVANAQLAVGNPTKYPEFAGNVKSMESRGYWRTREQSNSKQDYHYWRNAETFMLVGDALGRGMIDLLGASNPQPNVWTQTAGGVQNWINGPNWQDGSIPNPTSTTTMDFSSVNIAADTTLNLGADRTAQIWKFGDSFGTQNWIVAAGNTTTLAGTTPTIEVSNNTTRLENFLLGSAGLTKTGGGNLTLTAINTYTGPTTITAGTLQLGNGGTTGSLAASGALTNNAALVFDRSNDLIQGTDFPAAITGTGTLTKQGPGVLTLSGSNTYSGNTTVNGGTLRVTSHSGLGSSSLVAVGGNRLEIVTDSALSSSPGVSSQGGTIVSDRGTPGTGLTRVFGSASIGNGLTTFSAGLNVTSGISVIQLASVTNNNGSTATPGLNPTTANLIITGDVTMGVVNTGTANFTLGGTGSVNSISGGILNGTRATGNVIKSGTSTWTLSGTNNYTGTTTATGGLLIVTKAAALPGFNTVAKVVFNDGTIGAQVGGSGWTTTEVDTLLANATKTSGALGLDTTNGNTTQWTPFTTTNFGSAIGLTKLGANALTLNLANTYAGATTIGGGILALGVNNALPATAVSIGNATLDAATFSDTVGTLNVTGKATLNLGAGAALAFATGRPAWTGTLTGTFVSGSSLRFGTGSSGLTTDQLSRISALGFAGFGLNSSGYLTATVVPTYTITNTTTDANGTCTPTGITTVAAGGSQTYTLLPNADYVVAALTVSGVPVTPAQSYTFTNVSANQTIQATFVNIATAALHWDSNSSTPGFGNTTGTWGANQFWTIDASGTSVPLPITTTASSSVHFGTATLNYNNTAVTVAAGGVSAGNITFGAGQSTALTLSGGNITLGGAAVITVNNASNTIASVLAGAATSLTKAGTGSLTLSAANTYSGVTDISSGTATLNPTGVNLIIGSFEGGNTGISTLKLGGTTPFNRIDDAIENGARTTQHIFKSNTSTWTLSGDNDYTGNITIEQGTLKVGASGAIPSGAGKGNVIFNNAANNATLDLNGNDATINGLTQATISTTNRVVNHAAATLATLTVGSNDATSTFAGILADHTGTGGTLALTKIGSGTLTLHGANTYTGNTTVSAGTLVLADNAQLKFVIGVTSGTNNRITGAVTLNGDFNIDTSLTDGSTLTTGLWTIVDAATFGSTFTLIGAGWSETADVWTKTVGNKNYTFTEATGILALSSGTSYASWAATNAPSTPPAQDQDNDGVSNAVEYILGGNSLTNDLSKLPTISPSGENILFSFKRIQSSIHVGTAVNIQVGTTLQLFAVLKKEPRQPVPKAEQVGSTEIGFDPSRFLVRPFHAEGNGTALALDGGALPIAHGQIPSVVVGKNVLRTLHLARVHDWSQAECRTSFKNLLALYASEQAASLPALRIYLNPVFSDSTGETLHRAMLQVFFRSRIRENYLLLASELSAGTLPPDAEAIRKRVEEIDPTLIDDWTTRLDWLENDIAQAFSTARTQQARNAALLEDRGPAQLTSMLAILPRLANSEEIVAFLQDANTK